MPTRLVVITILSVVPLLSACIFSGSGPANGDANNTNNTNNDPAPELCGNGRIDPGETCDPCDKFSCPTGGCDIWAETGSADDCNLACAKSGEQTLCGDGDNCCPDGCGEADDDDCSADCGNLILDEDEVCDPCPDACADDPCAPVEQSGGPTTCDLVCSPLPEPLGCCGGEFCPDDKVCSPEAECVEPGCVEGSCTGPGEVCVDGVCIVPPSCEATEDCELWEQCDVDQGRCVVAENCTMARDRKAWCVFDSFEEGGQSPECDPFSMVPPECTIYMPIECVIDADCRPWEHCVASNGDDCTATECFCRIPETCAKARDGEVYCKLKLGETRAVCDGENCI